MSGQPRTIGSIPCCRQASSASADTLPAPKARRKHRAHIFVAFLAYALHTTLRRRLRDLAPGLTGRAVLDKLQAIQMVDVHLPTTDGREVVLSRYTQPAPDAALLLQQLRLPLPAQPSPRLSVRIPSLEGEM